MLYQLSYRGIAPREVADIAKRAARIHTLFCVIERRAKKWSFDKLRMKSGFRKNGAPA